MGHGSGDSLADGVDSSDSEEFEFGFLGGDSVDSESAFGIIEKTEELVGLFDADNIHETSWVVDIGSDFPIDFDESLCSDLNNFSAGKSVLQSVSQEENQGQRFSEFVRTR